MHAAISPGSPAPMAGPGTAVNVAPAKPVATQPNLPDSPMVQPRPMSNAKKSGFPVGLLVPATKLAVVNPVARRSKASVWFRLPFAAPLQVGEGGEVQPPQVIP